MKPASTPATAWRTPSIAIAWVAILTLSGAAAALEAGNAATDASAEAPEASLSSPSLEVEQTWYARSRTGTKFGVVITHYWSKGGLFRADAVVAGHPITTIVNGPRYYIYDSARADGAAIERNLASIAEDATRGRPFGRELRDLLALGAEKVSEGTLAEGSIGVEVYQLTNDKGRRRVVVTKSDPRVPIEVETFVRETGSTGLLEYAGWQLGLDLRDSFFDPPGNIVFEQISYLEYTSRFGKVPIGPAPVYYRDLLHGGPQKYR